MILYQGTKLLEQLSWQSNRLLTDRSQVRVLLQAPWPVGETVNSHAFHACIHGFESRTGHHFGGLAQLGEHLPYKQRVSGSSPLTSTIKNKYAGLAQLVEQLTCNQQVEGSSPLAGTILLRMWRNWQTHQTQDLAPSACRFDSCHPHQLLGTLKAFIDKGFGSFFFI